MRPFDRYPGIHSKMKKSVQNVSNFSVQKKIMLGRFSQCMLVDYTLGVCIIKKILFKKNIIDEAKVTRVAGGLQAVVVGPYPPQLK